MLTIKILFLEVASKILKIFDRVPRKMISGQKWLSFINEFRPMNNGFDLIRLGGEGDGSYLIPNDLIAIQKLISPGVGQSRMFEDDLFESNNITSILIDPFSRPTHMNLGDEYLPKLMGGGGAETVTLNSIIENQPEGDLILQMDIESGEYVVLSSISIENLARFRIMVIEFHRVDNWPDEIYFEQVISPIFDKIFEIFQVVHIHPHTSTGYFIYKDVKFPRFAEITFHRKDRNKQELFEQTIPNKLDTLTKQGDIGQKWFFTNNFKF